MQIASTTWQETPRLKFATAAHEPSAVPWGFAEWFIISQTALPAMLCVPGMQSFRLLTRVLPYVVSLAALFLFRARLRQRDTARRLLIACHLYLGLMILHPTTNSFLAGTAQVALYVSVLAPLFWAPSLVRTPAHLSRLLWLLLLCNGANACVGILQVYDPARWLPAEFSKGAHEGINGVGSVSYKRADGRLIVRPPGLFDTPGAVCYPGMIATLLGLAFAVQPLPAWRRAMSVAMSVAGLMAVLLSHVRTMVVILILMVLVYAGMLLLQRRVGRMLWILGASLGLCVLGWSLALSLGGSAVADRFLTLVEENPEKVLKNSGRSPMLQHAFEHTAVEYPLGAGLGRWGMMRKYFGDESNLDSPRIWAEIQPQAFFLDGGIPFFVLYYAALVLISRDQLRLLRRGSKDFSQLAEPVFVLTIGTIVKTVGFCAFTCQVGVQFWFLVGALEGAAAGDGYPAHSPPVPRRRVQTEPADPTRRPDAPLDDQSYQ